MTRWRHTFAEESAPCGVAGALTLDRPFLQGAPPDVSDCRAIRPWISPIEGDRHPARNTIVIWEPLPTKAPAPPKALAFCCDIRTVIFYHFPYIIRPPRPWRDRAGRLHPASGPGTFVEWDRTESRFTWDDLIRFEGDLFAIRGGHVAWKARRWWMVRLARRRGT